MSKRVLHVEIQSAPQALGRAGRVMRQIAAGQPVARHEGVGFETMDQFLSVFTPRRWELIRELKRAGPMTVYALAKRLGRNYKNVHGDVKALSEWMVIARDAKDRVFVPYDEIDARLPLAAREAA